MIRTSKTFLKIKNHSLDEKDLLAKSIRPASRLVEGELTNTRICCSQICQLAVPTVHLEEVSDIASRVDRGSIERTIDILLEAWKNDSQIFVIGNGGSASTATHFACDLNKWVSDKAERKFRAFALVDNIPLVSALTNDNGWGDVYSEQLTEFFQKGGRAGRDQCSRRIGKRSRRALVSKPVESSEIRQGPWREGNWAGRFRWGLAQNRVRFVHRRSGKLHPPSGRDAPRTDASDVRAAERKNLSITGNLLRDSLGRSALRQKFNPGAIEFGDGFLGSLVERHSLQDFCGDGHDVGSARDRRGDVGGSSDASHNQPGTVAAFLRKSYIIPDDLIGVFPDFFRPVIE